MELSALLLEEMRRRGLSKKDFAAFLGEERSVVSRWLSGDSIPRTEGLVQISEKCGLPLEQVMKAAGADAKAQRERQEKRDAQAEENARLRSELAETKAALVEARDELVLLRRRRRRA